MYYDIKQYDILLHNILNTFNPKMDNQRHNIYKCFFSIHCVAWDYGNTK